MDTKRRLRLALLCSLAFTGCDLAQFLEPEHIEALTSDAGALPGRAYRTAPMLLDMHGRNAYWGNYPSALNEAGQRRSVEFSVWVGPTGAVESTRITRSSGHPDVDRAATRLIERWRYEAPRWYDHPDGMWVENQRVGWPLIVIDCVGRPDVRLDEVESVDIDHVEIVKGRAAQFIWAEWATSSVIEIYTKSYAGPTGTNCGRPLRLDRP